MSAYVIENKDTVETRPKWSRFREILPYTSFSDVKKTKKLRNTLITAAVLIVLVVIFLAVYFGIQKKSSKSNLPQFQEMEGDVKRSIDPCDDFYEYSCGSYIDKYLPYRNTLSNVFRDKFISLGQENVIKAKEAIENMKDTKDPFFKKAFQFYQTCMSGIRTMAPYFKAVDDIGGSSITTIGKFDYYTWNLETALLKLKLNYNTNPLFKIHIGHDLFKTSRNIILVKPPDAILSSNLAGEKDEFPYIQRAKDDILDYDFDAISSLTTGFNTNIKTRFAIAAATRTKKSFSETFAKLSRAIDFEQGHIRDKKSTMSEIPIRKMYKVMSVGELSNIVRSIRWLHLLKGLFPPEISSTINIQTAVGLMVPISYLQKVETYVSSQRSSLPDYFAWGLVKRFAPVLPDDYFASFYFGTLGNGIDTVGKERWRACMLDTELAMPLSVGMMFTKYIITDLAVKKTTEMFVEIQNAFKAGIKLLTWLDQATKDAVEKKINEVLHFITGPSFLKGQLNGIYQDVTVDGKTRSQMFESCMRNIVQLNLKRYGKLARRDELDFGGFVPKLYDVNAFYLWTSNLMFALSGIIRAPVLYDQGQSYINFAKIGAILGHELLHGFDSQGWHFDKYGQISPWTTKHSQDGFNLRAECVKRQYDSYISGTMTVNGTKTLAENIADNAGLKYAYLAYKNFNARNHKNETKPPALKDLSYDQLFFIGYGQLWCRAASNTILDRIVVSDIHSPNRYRVIGSVSNLKEFSDAFKCPRGSRMNPIKRCEFW